MQLQQVIGSAPALAAHGLNGQLRRMQSHAPMHALVEDYSNQTFTPTRLQECRTHATIEIFFI